MRLRNTFDEYAIGVVRWVGIDRATALERTFRTRGFDFDTVSRVFDGLSLEYRDERIDDGEDRSVAIGTIDDSEIVPVIAWT